MRKYFIWICLISIFYGLTAQDSTRVDLSTPQDAIRTHLYFLQDDSYDESLAAKPFLRSGITEEQAITSAIWLKQIWDGEGLVIALDQISEDPQYYDSTKNAQRYHITGTRPDIYLDKTDGQWKFSVYSINSLEAIHEEVFPYGTDKLLELLPQMGTRKVLGMYLYQYLGILILSLVSILIHKVLSFIIEQLLARFLLQAGYEKLADHFLLPVAKPISIFAVILLLSVLLPVLQLPADASHWIMISLKTLLPLFATIVFYRLVDVLSMYLEHLATKTQSTLDDQLVPLVRKTLKTFVVSIGTLFILQNLDIPIIPLLTGLSIGGLAFALAAQDTIKNFFGSLMIFIDKPFQIGDWITSGEIDGSVEEVGFRSSRVRTFRNSLMYVPNGKLADSTIDNHGMREYRRFYTQIAVTYDTPAELLETFIVGLRKIVENHPDTRKDYYHIYFNEMASFSLNIMFYIFFKVPDWPAELKARHEILMEVMKLGRSLGVHFAFPTQTLHMENFPGKPSLSPEYPEKEKVDQQMAAYFNQTK
ncbi:MAG: MscS family membrane protein [Marinoscillum sp.]|jgi:MscS family membrane protein